jgi:hypothetical protein
VFKACELDDDDVEGSADDDLAYAFDAITAASARADILGASSSLGGSGATGDRADEIGPRCLVLEYYRKPCNDYMEGRHWIQVNRTIVWPRADDDEHPDGEAPLPEGFWPPVVGFGDTPIPGTIHEMGLLQPVVSLNCEYNTVNAKIEEHNIMMAMGGKWILSSADQGLRITTDPGQKLVSKGYDQNKPPIQAAMQALPAPVYAERERIISDVMLVASQNEIAMGKKPEGVSSGRGFLVLQEAVDSVLSPLLMGMEDGFAELGRRVLVLASRHYAVERLVRIRGNQGQWEVRSFKGADLGDSIDVQVQIGSMFPWSKSAKQDMVLSVLQALPGLVTDPATGAVDQAKVARYLDQGGIRAFEAEGNPDLIEVELEHGQFEDGQQPQIGFWQNHAAHLAAHAEFLKTERARFEKWPPRQQQAFLSHMQQTQLVLAGQVQRLAAPPEPTPGGAADPAGGPAAGIAGDAPASDLKLTAGDRASAEPGGGG